MSTKNVQPINLNSGFIQPDNSDGSPLSTPLEDAVRGFLVNHAANAPTANGGVETAQVGPYGTHLLVKQPKKGFADQANDFLAGVGQQYLQQKTQTNRSNFVAGVHQIMSSNAPREDKMGALLDLQDQHGTDYGVGLNAMAGKLGLNRDSKAANTPKSGKADMVLGKFQQGTITDPKTGTTLDLTDPDAMHKYALDKLGGNYDTQYPQVSKFITDKIASMVPAGPLSEDDIAKLNASSAPVAPGAQPAGTAPAAAPAASPVPAASAAAPAPAVAANGQPAPAAFQAGEQRVINGKIYTRNAQGQWLPAS